ASTVNRKRPFQHPAIYTLIARYWFSGLRDSVIKAARDRFLEMPDNLVAFVCNALETALVDIATGVHQFTNKVYAPKWVNLMGILKVMSTKAPDVHAGIKRFLAESTINATAAHQAGQKETSTEEADKDEGDFMSWKDIEVTSPQHAGSSRTKATTVGAPTTPATPTTPAAPGEPSALAVPAVPSTLLHSHSASPAGSHAASRIASRVASHVSSRVPSPAASLSVSRGKTPEAPTSGGPASEPQSETSSAA
ncbi:hypothetical protein FOMPIDRAFT_1054438, partial [Fomitopsis schrenkii]